MPIEVDLKDAACLRYLNRERFLAFIEGEDTLLWTTAACCLMESVSSHIHGDCQKTYRSH